MPSLLAGVMPPPLISTRPSHTLAKEIRRKIKRLASSGVLDRQESLHYRHPPDPITGTSSSRQTRSMPARTSTAKNPCPHSAADGIAMSKLTKDLGAIVQIGLATR